MSNHTPITAPVRLTAQEVSAMLRPYAGELSEPVLDHLAEDWSNSPDLATYIVNFIRLSTKDRPFVRALHNDILDLLTEQGQLTADQRDDMPLIEEQ